MNGVGGEPVRQQLLDEPATGGAVGAHFVVDGLDDLGVEAQVVGGPGHMASIGHGHGTVGAVKPWCSICLERDRPSDLALLASVGGDDLVGSGTPSLVYETYVHRSCHEQAVKMLEPSDSPGPWPHRPLLAGPVPDAA